MAIKIEIIQTKELCEYINADTRKLVGKVNNARNKPNTYYWETDGGWGFGTEEQVHDALKYELIRTAMKLGEAVNFINFIKL